MKTPTKAAEIATEIATAISTILMFSKREVGRSMPVAVASYCALHNKQNITGTMRKMLRLLSGCVTPIDRGMLTLPVFRVSGADGATAPSHQPTTE